MIYVNSALHKKHSWANKFKQFVKRKQNTKAQTTSASQIQT